MYVKKYSIKKIFISMLKRWYIICFAGVLGALLLGWLGYIKSDEPAPGTVILTEEQIKEVKYLQALRLQEEHLVQYRDGSAIMKIDAGNVHKYVMQYYIKADNLTDGEVTSLTGAYCSFVNNGMLYVESDSQVLEGFNIRDLDYAITAEYEEQTSLFTVRIIWGNQEELRQLGTYVNDALMMQQEYYTDMVGMHELIGGENACTVGIDTDLMEFQSMVHYNIKITHDTISNLEAKMISAQKKMADGENVDEILEVETAAKKINIKDLICRFGTGCFIVMALFIIRYMMLDYITTEEEVNGLLNGKYAGCIQSDMNQKSENRIVLNKIIMKCKRDKESEVLFLLCNENSMDDEIKTQITSVLHEEKISVKFGYEIMRNLSLQKEVISSKTVFLLIKLGEDKFKDIIEMLEFCESQEVVISDTFAIK